jgi:hypothetical protein
VGDEDVGGGTRHDRQHNRERHEVEHVVRRRYPGPQDEQPLHHGREAFGAEPHGGELLGARQPGTHEPTPPGPPPFTAVEVNDLAELCRAGEHRATPSRPHTGPGPNPIVAFSKDADQGEYTRDYLVHRDGAGYDPQRPEEVALLARITGVKTGKRVGTCRYKTTVAPTSRNRCTP